LKTQITDWLFLYNTVMQVIDKGLNIRLKIFYFTLEMSKEEKMLSAFSNILFIKEGIRVTPTQLKSTRASEVLPQEVLDIIQKYKPYFQKIEEIVEFVDDIRNPTGIYKFVRQYAHSNGTQHTKVVKFVDNKTGETREKEIDDWYEPNDPDEYVMVIIDHVSLISTETENGRKLSLHESIVRLSSNYLITLRNKFNYIPVMIQQQASSQESVENMKHGRLKPTLDGLGDCKLTQRDANVILGLFSPFRHEIKSYHKYDVTFFKDNIRFLEVLGGREGGGGTVCPLYFDGAVNFFKELPRSDDAAKLSQVYERIRKIR
jgi:hypothetical protein